LFWKAGQFKDAEELESTLSEFECLKEPEELVFGHRACHLFCWIPSWR